jgi:hypothetical protein
VHHTGEQEIERTQAEDGKNIGRVDDKRVGGYGKNRRYRVQCENHVSDFDGN